jgi:hypothetical protein
MMAKIHMSTGRVPLAAGPAGHRGDENCAMASSGAGEGRAFRPDLYYRLHVFCIDLPPLRDRREDIPRLVNHFLNKYSMVASRPVPQISPEALKTPSHALHPMQSVLSYKIVFDL